MLGLNQDTVALITTIAVSLLTPVMSIIVAALLSRQIFRFGLDRNWGPGGKDMQIDGF